MLFENIKYLNKNFEIESNAYIQTEGKKIVYIGKEKPAGYSGQTLDGANKVVIPGLYNMHSHIPMTILRGYGSGLNLEDWLFTKIFPFEALLEAGDVECATNVGLCELIASGCCSFQDSYFFTPNIGKAVQDSGMKANISDCFSCPDEHFNIKEMREYKMLKRSLEMKKSGELGSRVIIDASIHSCYTSSDKFIAEFAELANSNNLIKHTHLSETPIEQKTCKDAHNGKTPTEVFEELGLFDGAKTITGHGTHINEKDIEIIKRHNVGITRCYSSNLKLGSGVKTLHKELIDAGLEYIGTDGPSSNNNLNMMEELHLAAMVPPGIEQNPVEVSPKTILKMATIDSAKAQGRENCGYIDVGMKADMVVFDLNKPHLQPDTDTVYNLLYSAQSSDICMNMVDGKVLYKNGEFLTIDVEKAMHDMNKSFKKIVSQL